MSDGWPNPVIANVDPVENEDAYASNSYRRIHREPMAIERSNLLTVSKLITKELIDSSMEHGRMLDDDHVPLQQFFVVLEHILKHGIKVKKGLLSNRRDFWNILEQVEKHNPDAVDITSSVRDMPNLKTPLGRARAWLRLALMQKRLADYFRLLVDKKDELLAEYYESGSLMLGEEALVFSGLLVGLNVIDCNLGIKDADLDQPMGVIDFSLYLRNQEAIASVESAECTNENAQASTKMSAILDQKNYLEELNRHLNATVTNLHAKVETLTTESALMKEDLTLTRNELSQCKSENEVLRTKNKELEEGSRKRIESVTEDRETERETYQSSRAGLDSMYTEAQKQLREETQMRIDLEKEMELQIAMKTEMEMAMQLLEKDIHEKQDSIIQLRKQLEEVKQMNLEMSQKLESSDGSLTHKTDLVTKLDVKANQMSSTIKDLESKLKQSESDRYSLDETARKLGQQLAEKDAKRTTLETDLKIEREWRSTLQKSLEQEKLKVNKLQEELLGAKENETKLKELEKQNEEMKQLSEEQEKALSELGSHLSESKLKMEDMKEVQQALKEAAWTDDNEVVDCKQCEKVFSVARRKHHCRNCGDIFCNDCSDNKMPLPSSAKPVRVCDGCHTLLLQRYSAK